MSEDDLLTEGQLAKVINRSPRTLQGDRQRGRGIPYVKIGRSVRYRWGTVREHLAQCVRTSTSDLGNVTQGGDEFYTTLSPPDIAQPQTTRKNAGGRVNNALDRLISAIRIGFASTQLTS